MKNPGMSSPSTVGQARSRGATLRPTWEAFRAALRGALEAGYQVLDEGGASLDAVVAALRIMEESPLFNAGKGAVFTSEGTVELDASIMDGRTRNAGAVSGVKEVPSPITLARMVMEQSPHVMLTGVGAEAFAREHDVEMVSNDFFYTERRRRQLERAQQRENAPSGSPCRSTPLACIAAPSTPAATW